MSELYDKARESAKKAVNTLGDDALYAITLIAPHLRKGVFWGFATPKDLNVKALEGSQNIRALPIADSIIVEVNPSYVVSAIQSIDPNLIRKQDIDLMEKNMAMATVECTKYLLNNGIRNGSAPIIMAVYCVNDVTSIVAKGKSFPAFRLNIEKALEILARLGYMVEVNGSFVSAVEAANNPSILNSMKLSPTKTGVFMKVRSTKTPDELKKIKKELIGK